MSPSATATEKTTGKQVELGRYVTDMREERILIGQRVDGVVCVYDAPLRDGGRRYLVERGFGSKAELAMLVRDYREQAERLGCCPMSRRAMRRLIDASQLEEIIA